MAAIYATAGNQVAALKELYTGDDYMKDLVYKKNPLMALVPKNESPSGFAGKYIPVPLVYGNPQGRSADFASAQTNQTPTALSSFFVYRVSNYALATISNELLEATKDDAGAFVDEAKLTVDGAFKSISNDLALDLYKDASGNRGTIATITTGVIQLTDANEIVNFEVGMTLVAYTKSGTTYAQVGASLGYVIAVNRSLGMLTVSATQGGGAGTPASWVATNLIGVQGDVAFGALTVQTSFKKVSGLAAWLPLTAPVQGESFWGVDRSADVTRLGGVRFDGSGESIEEALIDGCALVAREGGMPDMAFMSFASYAALEKSLGAKVQYVNVKHDDVDIAFDGIKINAPYGPVTVIPDRNCPSKTAYVLQMDTWKFRSLGKAPHILTYGSEGLEGLRVGNADALEMRIGYYGNLICNAPGWNVVVALQM